MEQELLGVKRRTPVVVAARVPVPLRDPES